MGSMDSRAQLWLDHAWPVLPLLMGLALLFGTTELDISIARALFYDSSSARWIGAGSWLVNDLIHTGGRWLVRIVVLLALTLWTASFFAGALRDLQRPVGYLMSAVILTIGITGLLKLLTNIDCPWDLSEFGGRRPYVGLLSGRPDGLAAGHCFPAAHASSGYAFMALYFLAYERSRTLARVGLAVGLCLGAIFGLAQQSRGAHFASHDLWSAFLGWMIPLTLYAFAFGGRLYAGSQRCASCGSQRLQPSSRQVGQFQQSPLVRLSERPSERCSTSCARKD